MTDGHGWYVTDIGGMSSRTGQDGDTSAGCCEWSDVNVIKLFVMTQGGNALARNGKDEDGFSLAADHPTVSFENLLKGAVKIC